MKVKVVSELSVLFVWTNRRLSNCFQACKEVKYYYTLWLWIKENMTHPFEVSHSFVDLEMLYFALSKQNDI